MLVPCCSCLQLLEAERGLLRPRGVRRAHVHVAREGAAAAGLALDLLEALRHVLDVLVVRCDTEAHEAKRDWELLEQVHVHVRVILEEVVCGVEGGRSAPDNRDVPRARCQRGAEPSRQHCDFASRLRTCVLGGENTGRITTRYLNFGQGTRTTFFERLNPHARLAHDITYIF